LVDDGTNESPAREEAPETEPVPEADGPAPVAEGDAAAAEEPAVETPRSEPDSQPEPPPAEADGAETPPTFIAVAAYGAMGTRDKFCTDIEGLPAGTICVLRTSRGTEIGRLLSAPTLAADGSARHKMGKILRRATDDDLERARRIDREKQPSEADYCREKIREHKLPMRLAAVEHLFGGEKVVFYFRSEGRVDFRALVRDLAKRYKTRIEMRQIGVRDEAKLMSDYEHCGRPLCCRSFLGEIEPVTMRMAKLQKTTLDPAKISGCCGRLMCCLRFEDDVYRELKKLLPHKGTVVQTEQVTGEVRSSDVLAQTVDVRTSDGAMVTVRIADVLSRQAKEAGQADPKRRAKPEADVKAKTEGQAPAKSPRRRRGKDQPRKGRRRRSRRSGKRGGSQESKGRDGAEGKRPDSRPPKGDGGEPKKENPGG